MRTLTICLLSTLAGCGGLPQPPADVAGPFTGAIHRYRVDAIAVPQDSKMYGDDLDGDERVENQLGLISGAFWGEGITNKHVAELVASGAITSIVELQSDDPALHDDPTIGVRFIGGPGDAAGTMGGVLRNGVVTTNRLRFTHAPVPSTLHVPVLPDADPVTLPLAATQLDLTADGKGGWNMTLQGAVKGSSPQLALFVPSLLQGWALHPEHYGTLLAVLDHDRNGHLEMSELLASGILTNVMSPDVELFGADGNWGRAANEKERTNDALSVGIGFHLTACTDDACSLPKAAPTCFDRARNGDEIDVDCGGSCGACAAGAACTAESDCQSHCVEGRCAEPTCSDGKADGVEGGVDCGWGCAMGCPDHDGCVADGNCLSGSCNSGLCGPKSGS
jgi:hypothetical protein